MRARRDRHLSILRVASAPSPRPGARGPSFRLIPRRGQPWSRLRAHRSPSPERRMSTEARFGIAEGRRPVQSRGRSRCGSPSPSRRQLRVLALLAGPWFSFRESSRARLPPCRRSMGNGNGGLVALSPEDAHVWQPALYRGELRVAVRHGPSYADVDAERWNDPDPALRRRVLRHSRGFPTSRRSCERPEARRSRRAVLRSPGRPRRLIDGTVARSRDHRLSRRRDRAVRAGRGSSSD